MFYGEGVDGFGGVLWLIGNLNLHWCNTKLEESLGLRLSGPIFRFISLMCMPQTQLSIR